MGINWGSAIAKGVSVAGAHYQAERDKKAVEKRAFDQKTELLGIQHANAIALQNKEYEGKFKIETAKINRKDALRSQIRIRPFMVAGTEVPGASFFYGGENVSANEFDEGLKTAYVRAAQHFQIIKNSGIAPEQAQKIWEQYYAPALSRATGSLYSKYAGDNDKKNKMPPSASNILGLEVGRMPEIQNLWEQQYSSNFSPATREKMESWGRATRAFGVDAENLGASPTRNASLSARIGSGNLDQLAESVMLNKNFLSAAQAFINATEEGSGANLDEARANMINVTRTALVNGNQNLDPSIARTLSDSRVLQIGSDATVLVQRARRRNPDNPEFVELNPSFREIKTSEIRNQRFQTGINLSRGTMSLVKSLLSDNPPDVSRLGGETRGFVARVLTGTQEVGGFIQNFVSGSGDNLRSGASLLEERGDIQLSKQLLSELNTGTLTEDDKKQLEILSNKIEGIQTQIDETVSELKTSPDNITAMNTYNFHMDRLYLAYAYSKFVQGGGGGNAVSNADFQNTMNALFGEFGNTPEQQRAILASGMMRLHHQLQKDLKGMELERRYGFSLDDKLRDTSTPFAKRVADVEYRRRQAIVDARPDVGGNYYESTNQYWRLEGISDADFSGRTFGQEDADELNTRAGTAG